ncbi:MAG: hypothetical protein AAF243_13775 [Cyanobacteria bacterium P01_A01_bin.137]
MSNAANDQPQTVQDRLARLRHLAQAFPKEQREDVLLELDDLSANLRDDEASLQTLHSRLKRLAAIAMMARMFATNNQQAIEEFASNLVALTKATKIAEGGD